MDYDRRDEEESYFPKSSKRTPPCPLSAEMLSQLVSELEQSSLASPADSVSESDSSDQSSANGDTNSPAIFESSLFHPYAFDSNPIPVDSIAKLICYLDAAPVKAKTTFIPTPIPAESILKLRNYFESDYAAESDYSSEKIDIDTFYPPIAPPPFGLRPEVIQVNLDTPLVTESTTSIAPIVKPVKLTAQFLLEDVLAVTGDGEAIEEGAKKIQKEQVEEVGKVDAEWTDDFGKGVEKEEIVVKRGWFGWY